MASYEVMKLKAAKAVTRIKKQIERLGGNMDKEVKIARHKDPIVDQAFILESIAEFLEGLTLVDEASDASSSSFTPEKPGVYEVVVNEECEIESIKKFLVKRQGAGERVK